MQILPEDRVLSKFGFGADIADVRNLETKISGISPDIEGVLRGVRRRVYVSGAVDPEILEKRAFDLAVREQCEIDGLCDPVGQEPSEDFTERLRRWRNFLALRLLAVANGLPSNQIIGDVSAVSREGFDTDRIFSLYLNGESDDVIKQINENTPLDELLDIIALTDDMDGLDCSLSRKNTLNAMRAAAHEHLIRKLLSFDKDFIGSGRKFLRYKHYDDVLRKMGGVLSRGRIGGKAANMLLAYAVLEADSPEFDDSWDNEHRIKSSEVKNSFDLKENVSYFVGSMVFDEVVHGDRNGRTVSESEVAKYRVGSEQEMEARHARLNEAIMEAKIPEYLVRQLREVFDRLSGAPAIVRSSSELEDLEGASFAGQYESVYLPNSGADDNENFGHFLAAVKTVYASVYGRDVLNYRRERGLDNCNEEMGLLIQVLNGRGRGKYFYPDLAGVAMSYAPQTPGPNPQRGFMTLVHGFGNRAVDVGGRIVMFDKPNVEIDPEHPYSQRDVSVVDLETGETRYVGVGDLAGALAMDGKDIPYICSGFGRYGQLDYLPGSGTVLAPNASFSVDFKNLLDESGANFSIVMEYIVKKLEHSLGYKVDVEFTACRGDESRFQVNVVQCRPQNISEHLRPSLVPENVSQERILLDSSIALSSARRMNIRYVLYVDPDVSKSDCEGQLSSVKGEVKQLASYLESIASKFSDGEFLCVVPGRFGSEDPALGLPVNLRRFLHTAGFVELTGKRDGVDSGWAAEPSAGTHAGQLVFEKGIANFGVSLGGGGGVFKKEIFDCSGVSGDEYAERLGVEIPRRFGKWIRVIDTEELGRKICGHDGEWRIHVAQNNLSSDNVPQRATVYIAQRGSDRPVGVSV